MRSSRCNIKPAPLQPTLSYNAHASVTPASIFFFISECPEAEAGQAEAGWAKRAPAWWALMDRVECGRGSNKRRLCSTQTRGVCASSNNKNRPKKYYKYISCSVLQLERRFNLASPLEAVLADEEFNTKRRRPPNIIVLLVLLMWLQAAKLSRHRAALFEQDLKDRKCGFACF